MAEQGALNEIQKQLVILVETRSANPSVASGANLPVPAVMTIPLGGKACETTNKGLEVGVMPGAVYGNLLSQSGMLATHVTLEVKEKIWKGAYVDIFALIRSKRRDVEYKEREGKEGSFRDRKMKVEESLTNWLFGFHMFTTVLLEKKPELAISLVFYTNKIVKAHATHGGSAWLDYDREFRWAKEENPNIGWDQVEINAWLENVNGREHHSKQPFRTSQGGPGEKKGSCWAFNKKVRTWPPGQCRFRHACSFCGHSSHPEFKCNKKSKERGGGRRQGHQARTAISCPRP
ncbi:uncharacterized protein LOC144769384 [Lissotriton helveticus]